MKSPTPAANDITELVAFLPRLHATDVASLVTWSRGVNQETGGTFLPAPNYANVIREFIDVASKPCWTDYRYTDRDVPRLLANADGLAQLEIAEIKSVLTFVVRGERFCDGHWAAMIEAGHVRRVLERLAELGAEARGRSVSPPEEVVESTPWPDDLLHQTLVAVAELSITQDRFLEIKHRVLGESALFAFDDCLLVHRFTDGRKWKYPDVEALLTAGWAIDQVRRGIITN